MATDQLPSDTASSWRRPAAGRDDLAFLQYTSGSTAQPKGVMVSHGNLLHNEALIQRFKHTSEASRGVGWLPLYHDMGLIGNALHALYCGGDFVFLSPLDFLKHPRLWLEAISRYRADISGAPNFAYELCVGRVKPEERAVIDLSSWTLAYCGAEPIRAESLRKFAAAFEGCGFRASSLYPCYGLAEATLMVTGARRGEGFVSAEVSRSQLESGQCKLASPSDSDARTLVSSGRAMAGEGRLRVVDPVTLRRCHPGQVGEIWLASDSVARGYWNRPEETHATFQATIADTGEGPFLRTGDLGFVHEGELFVTGRLKDLIIVGGRNCYPQDIEATVEACHPALRTGCSAAFALDGHAGEALVIATEVARDYVAQAVDPEELVAAIRRSVTAEHEVRVHAVALLQAGTIPKTSSGKIQRHAARQAFVRGELTLWHQSSGSPG
ncbi:MAG: fatty acyl-AMP ligase [Deltaproteobacteria bacterium]|nr:fatty acyl-AMP ligase [Deltaproteobacteria bacterium]